MIPASEAVGVLARVVADAPLFPVMSHGRNVVNVLYARPKFVEGVGSPGVVVFVGQPLVNYGSELRLTFYGNVFAGGAVEVFPLGSVSPPW